jgi:hypothetical protein
MIYVLKQLGYFFFKYKVWTQGLTLVRQVLYHFSHIISPFFFSSVIFQIGSHFSLEQDLNHNSPTSFLCSWETGVYHHTQLVNEKGLTNFLCLSCHELLSSHFCLPHSWDNKYKTQCLVKLAPFFFFLNQWPLLKVGNINGKHQYYPFIFYRWILEILSFFHWQLLSSICTNKENPETISYISIT